MQAEASSDPDPVRKVALVGLEMRLENDAKQQACLRCSEADFFLTWQPLIHIPEGESEWVPVLARCGKFMSLASNPEGGLLMPSVPFPHCSAMSYDKE